MPWWQDNYIANMYGPDFLKVYFVTAVLVVVVGWAAKYFADRTRIAATPEVPERPDPYAIAHLRGGANEVVRLAVFNLLRRGYLASANSTSLRVTSEDYLKQAETAPSVRDLNRIEKAVFDHAARQKKPREFLKPSLTSIVETLAADYEQQHTEQRFRLPRETRVIAGWIIAIGLAVILGLGGFKLVVALAKGKHNVAFLILIGIGASLVHMLVCWPRRISDLGKRYIERLKSVCSESKSSLAATVIDPGETSALLAVSVFGLAALGPTSMSNVRDMFQQSNSNSSCGSTCGSSCGGGCGGGGCGGCGS
ncbi:MAG: TIGR04222 domain-containing membrane protein [Phycisphaerales bacterium]|nr:TIGR04222 domain-containing membrane protein [Phycisphaerales bacterium]MCB9857190.1 TIGR04222 domain-containing membrane protein [Phycisphaerales bacterium]MCB9863097.1 TIGR04222 domain-containing membrane protein [Phycisphaerales bacterium]